MADEVGNVAVAEPVASEAPELELAPEVQDEAVQVDTETVPEAEAAPESKWAGKSDEEIEAAIKAATEATAKDVEARSRQSERDRTTREFGRQQVQNSLNYVAQGGMKQSLDAIVAAVLEGNTNVVDADGRVKPGVERAIFQAAMPALRDGSLAEDLDLIGEELMPGAKVSQEALDEVDLLRHKTRQVDTRTGLPLATGLDVKKAALKAIIEANIEAARAGIEAEYAKKLQATAKGRAEVAGLRDSDAARTATLRPTGGAANGNVTPTNNRGILDSASPLSPEYRKAFKAEYGFDP